MPGPEGRGGDRRPESWAAPVRVLVPAAARSLLARQASAVNPVYYRRVRSGLGQRVLRKLRRPSPLEALGAAVQEEGNRSDLDAVVALWLPPEVSLPPPLMAAWLDRLPSLGWVYSQVSGTDHLDLESFKARGVMLSNSGTLVAPAVAEMALACILAHAKRLPGHFALQRRRRWRSLPADSIEGQTVGVIGTGNIGGHLAGLCRALGMRVIGASRDPSRFGVDPSPYDRVVSLDTELESLLGTSDHVVVALPLTAATRGMIGAEAFAAMRPGASVISVSRGEVVDERALCSALGRGRIGQAFIDRPRQTSLRGWSGLYRTPGLVLTHYSAAHDPRRLERACERFLAGLRALRETGQATDRVV